jgi:hypothetical protein
MQKRFLAILAPVFVLLFAAPAHAYHAPIALVEGEDMTGAGVVVADDAGAEYTSGGALRRLDENGRISAQVTTSEPATHVVVWARGGQSCDGWPRFTVRLDGERVGAFDADSLRWQPFSTPADIAPGDHLVEITYVNEHQTADCTRMLRIDSVELGHYPWRAFPRDSIWNRPASEKGEAVPNPYPDDLWLTYGNGLLVGGGPCGSSGHDYAYRKPIYFADASDPVTTNVTATLPSWQPRNDLRWDGRPIPIPAGVQPAEGTDGHLTIVDPDRKVAFEFWRAISVSPLGIVAATVSMYNLDGPGYSDYAGENSARGSGMPVISSTLRADEAYWGIHHALGFDVPSVGPDFVSPPASKSDGDNGPLEYGQLYVLRPDFEIPADAPRGVRNVLNALKVYGAYIADQGSNWQLDTDSSGDPALWCASGVRRGSFNFVKPSDLMLVNGPSGP